jgi:hypothetical protein
MGPDAAPREVRRLVAMAALLAGSHAGMIALAPALVEQDRPGAPAILTFVGLAVVGGAAWFAAIGPLERLAPGRALRGVHRGRPSGFGCKCRRHRHTNCSVAPGPRWPAQRGPSHA